MPEEGGYITGRGVPFYIHHRLAALAERQYLVFSVAQICALGITPSGVRKRARTGRLHRVHQGVYSLVPPALLTREGRYAAAVLACGPGAVLSHRDAAHLHEVRASQRTRIDVTVPGRTLRRHAGVEIHRSITLAPADVTRVGRIPCTSLARTLLDLAGVVPPRQLERAVELAEMMHKLDFIALEDQLARNRAAPAGARLRRVMESYLPGQAPTESVFEEHFLALCREIGAPVPRRQFDVDPGDGEPMVRLDFAWPEARFGVETDGRRYHTVSARFERDHRRVQRLMLAGWRISRITWRQLGDEPRRIGELVLAMLAVPR